jgi:hypothetical protein
LDIAAARSRRDTYPFGFGPFPIIYSTNLFMTGTCFFCDSKVPIAVFLGMDLLFTDPSPAPRTELGAGVFEAGLRSLAESVADPTGQTVRRR